MAGSLAVTEWFCNEERGSLLSRARVCVCRSTDFYCGDGSSSIVSIVRSFFISDSDDVMHN